MTDNIEANNSYFFEQWKNDVIVVIVLKTLQFVKQNIEINQTWVG